MPWYFYVEGGVPVSPRSPSGIQTGVVLTSVLPYTATPPEGYYFCDGQAISRNDNLALFGMLGTQWGIGDGSTTFNLPDYRSSIPQGVINFAQGIGDSAGAGGSKTHSHIVGAHTHLVVSTHSHTMPQHSHTFGNHTHTMAGHRHNPGASLNIAATTQVFNNADVNEGAPLGSDVQAINEGSVQHRHGNGFDGLSGVTSGGGTTSAGSSEGGSPATNTGLNSVSINAQSAANTALGSTSVTQLPPFFTASFIIKA